MLPFPPSPSSISPHMLQSNDLCLITGCKRRTSPDRLHIRSQIFIINPSPRMKVMAVPSLVRDPRLPCCLPATASLAAAAAFPNIPAVGRNRSSLMEGRQEVELECLSIYVVRAEKKQLQSGRGAKTYDQHLSLCDLVLSPLMSFKAENINTVCDKCSHNSKCVLGYKPSLSAEFSTR